MKTTIDLADALFNATKKLAAERGVTFREVVETALRKHLAEARKPRQPFKLRMHTFKGEGVQPGIDESDWKQMLSVLYEHERRDE